MNVNFTRQAIALVFAAVLGGAGLIACNGGGGGSSSSTPDTSAVTGTTLVGVFRDAPVSGLHFWAPSHHGKTDADGNFYYTENDTVEFGVATDDGDVALKFGGATGKGVITPMDLMSRDADSELVQAIARTLLQLDEDNDSHGGIQLNNTVASLLRGNLEARGLAGLNLEDLLALEGDDDHSTSDPLTDALLALDEAVDDTVEAALLEGAITDYVYVTYADAVAHLVNDDIFRKNVSKTPDRASSKAKLNVMPAYVPAMKADDTPILPVEGVCEVGVLKDGSCFAKPVVITYTDVDPRYESGDASDAFAAVSRDDGATWKRTNLSRTGDREVVNTGDTEFPLGFKGESRKPVMQVKGNYMVVTWSDKYCKGGSPAYSLVDPVTDEPIDEDLYGVAGNQGFVDYSEQNLDAERLAIAIEMTGGVRVPYSCVWASRGWVDPITGIITWSKAERLTSGRRDAYQLFVGGAAGGGFAISWQEDPEGLLAGSGDGPGDGFSGATVNHQTDIWYSYMPWSRFDELALIDPSLTAEDVDDNPNDPIDLQADGDGGGGGVQRVRLERWTVPVRMTDNAACNYANLNSEGHKWCRLTNDGVVADLDLDDDGVIDPDLVSVPPEGEEETVPDGRIALTDLNLKYCEALVWSNDASVGWVCQASDGRVLDGDTGASRPNLMMQPFTKKDGSISAYSVMGYEETKGTGAGPDDVDSLYVDEGKDSLYHSFEFSKPDVIAAGGIVNLPERDQTTRLPVVLIDSDDTHAPVYSTENSRRIRFIIQGKKPSLGKDTDGDGIGDTGQGTVLIALYKQGPEGKGRPSDIFARRMSVRNDDGTVKTGNPYAYENFVCEETDAWGQCLSGAQNMSSVEPLELGEPVGVPDSDIFYPKLLDWTWSVANLDDESWDTPMTESRAHRGQIRGDFVMMGYSFTPNWAAARNGNDKYDFFVRRSYDGGKTWTTDPKATEDTVHCKYVGQGEDDDGPELVCEAYGPGVSEPPRNVSLLKNHKESVIEPRIVAVPGSISATMCEDADGFDVQCLEDKQNANVVSMSFGLANNVDEDGDGELEQAEQYPTDMFYSVTRDKGTTFPVVEYPSGEGWDWLAMRQDVEEGEAQLRLTPDGSKLYATWLAESMAGYSGPDHFYGSDIWFRKILTEPVETAAE